ncbi:MAG TPA: glycosyl transferase group 1 [Prolixibacteraceae bacterium]|nr:glycosyl transferase group 1 [Marinilabiliales bacterium]HBL76780.1 glycosyl transferase group 1 [Prolixibacteraceae bacterium]HCU62839.1 glycosyl transferase group 1 [Prolixibacteraceae bacterium]
MKRIAISVINDLVTDNRVHKVATTLQEMGYEVTLIGRLLPESLPISRTYNTRRMCLFFTKGPWFYAEYNIRLFFILLFSKFNVFVSNDLDTLLPNFLVSKLTNSPLYYDSHEYFTEVPELVDRPKVRRAWENLEKELLPKIRNAYTVCQSIAEAYRYKYGTYFHVVRNVPDRMVPFEIPADKKLDFGGKKIILYQGALNIGRGLEQIVRAMQEIDNAVLVIAGDGDIAIQLKTLAHSLRLQDKVKFLGRMLFNEVKYITVQADLGLSIEEDLGLNYKYALPNKLFDYIQAEIPVLVSNLPEMKKIVTDYQVGAILDSHQPQQMAKQIAGILNNREQIAVWKENLKKAAGELCWENEKEALKIIYGKLRY